MERSVCTGVSGKRRGEVARWGQPHEGAFPVVGCTIIHSVAWYFFTAVSWILNIEKGIGDISVLTWFFCYSRRHICSQPSVPSSQTSSFTVLQTGFSPQTQASLAGEGGLEGLSCKKKPIWVSGLLGPGKLSQEAFSVWHVGSSSHTASALSIRLSSETFWERTKSHGSRWKFPARKFAILSWGSSEKMTVRGTMVHSGVCNSWCFCLGS